MLVRDQHTREVMSARAGSTHKGGNERSKYVTQVQQQRPESPTVTLTRYACKYYSKFTDLGKLTKSLTIPVNSRNYCFTQGFHEFPKNSRDFVKSAY